MKGMRRTRNTLMAKFLKEKRKFLLATLGVSLIFGVSIDAGAQKKSSKKQEAAIKQQQDLASSSEPDKVLPEALRHEKPRLFGPDETGTV